MPEKKTLNEDLFYKGSSANLLRLHTCENKVPFWDKSKSFASQREIQLGLSALSEEYFVKRVISSFMAYQPLLVF